MIRGNTIVAIALLLTACGASHSSDPAPTNTPSPSAPTTPGAAGSGGTQPVTPSITDYAKINSEIILPYCIKCHNDKVTKGGVNLKTYKDIVANLATTRSEIESGDMPPAGPLADKDKKLIIDWIDTGHPETVAQASQAAAEVLMGLRF